MIMIKKYYPYIISICICLFLCINSIIYVKNQYKLSEEVRYNYYNSYCLSENSNNIEYCELLKREFITKDYNNTNNVYDTFIFLIEEKRINVVFSLIGVILVGFPSIYFFHKKMEKGNLKNILMRIDYHKFIKKEYLKSLMASLIIPISLIIFLGASTLLSSNYKIGMCALDKTCSNYIIYQVSPWFYIFMLIFNSWLQSIGFINLTYIADRKSKNIFLTLIRTYILFIITILGTSFITVFAKSVLYLKNVPDFSINNMWNLTLSGKYFIIPTIMNMVFIIITFIMMNCMYKNKEKVMIDNE